MGAAATALLAELDDKLRRLLERELDVPVSFDPPALGWRAEQPGLGLFLYDLAEGRQHRTRQWTTRRTDDAAHRVGPPLRLAATYALTAWAPTIEQEHALLSRALAVLHAQDVLAGELAAARDSPARDLWSALGGEPKLAVPFRVLVEIEGRAQLARGAPVRAPAVSVGGRAGSHAATGLVRRADGTPAADAWIMLPGLGLATASKADGGFLLPGLPAGRHRLLVRGPGGEVGETLVELPGEAVAVTLGAAN
jgi:hypothetical protein